MKEQRKLFSKELQHELYSQQVLLQDVRWDKWNINSFVLDSEINKGYVANYEQIISVQQDFKMHE